MTPRQARRRRKRDNRELGRAETASGYELTPSGGPCVLHDIYDSGNNDEPGDDAQEDLQASYGAKTEDFL